MQQIATKQYNDGFVRGDNRTIGNHVAHTASYTMTDYDAGDIHTNKGASGAITITLPAAKEGRSVRFAKLAQQNMTITASNGSKINAGSANGSIANTAAENNKTLMLYSPDGVDWLTYILVGTWA